MALRGQRGLVRLDGKSWLGYYSTYAFDPATDVPVETLPASMSCIFKEDGILR